MFCIDIKLCAVRKAKILLKELLNYTESNFNASRRFGMQTGTTAVILSYLKTSVYFAQQGVSNW